MVWNLDAATAAWLALTAVLAATVAVLAWRLHRLRRLHGKDGGVIWIRVEVHNPLELARMHSRWGGQVGAFAPNMVRRRVYDIVSRELDAELARRGVEARVEVRRRAD